MDPKHSLLTTRIMVIASIIGSVATLILGTSFYLFYNYKLYPQPLGAKGTYTEYRIYTRATGEVDYKRNPIRETDSYDYRPISKSNYYRENNKTIYERVYSDGNKDVFTGFYAYREKITDHNRLIGGILYLPLIDVVLNFFWERNYRRRTTHY